MDQWSARNWKLIQFVIHAKLVKLHHKMKTCKISPDDLVKGDEGGVESGEALVDGLEVGVADVNHRVVGVQSAELKLQRNYVLTIRSSWSYNTPYLRHDVPDDVLAVLVERGNPLERG